MPWSIPRNSASGIGDCGLWMKSQLHKLRFAMALIVGLASLSMVSASGCALMVNPFEDELAGGQAVTTPSVEGARVVEATPSELVREHEASTLCAKGGTVTHGPLYFEDPTDEHGSDDGQFAWTAEDYWHFLSWRGRFVINGLFFPASVVVTPPWMVMESDGKPSREVLGERLDARPRDER
jgi:hypothetical protein